MSDEAAFLATIKSAPGDHTARLVYADWLDEHGRPGGDFLRVECALTALDLADDRRSAMFDKLVVASMDLDQDWIARVSRVSVQDINLRHVEAVHRFRYPPSFWQRRDELAAIAATEWFRATYPAARLIGTHGDVWAARQAAPDLPDDLIPFMIVGGLPFPDYYGFAVPRQRAVGAAELPVLVWCIHAYVHGWDTGFGAFLDELQAQHAE